MPLHERKMKVGCMKTKIALGLAVAAILSACGQTKTQDYYMDHPDELAADLAECKQLGKNTYNCNEAEKAAVLSKRKNGAKPGN